MIDHYNANCTKTERLEMSMEHETKSLHNLHLFLKNARKTQQFFEFCNANL